MWRGLVAFVLVLTLPVPVIAGPLQEAAERAARAQAVTQPPPAPRSRGRLWTAVALIAGGAALTVVGALETREDDAGTDTDSDEPAGADSNGLEKTMIGGGLAAVTAGSVLLLTGRHQASPSVATGRGRLVVRHTIRF